MSDEKDFENIQRILSDTSSAQIAIMTLTLTFQSAGLVGIYTIADKIKGSPSTDTGIVGLPLTMVIISFILGFVWLREHIMAEAFRGRLRDKYKVWEPTKSCWSGKTARMWMVVHGGSILIWLVVCILAASGCLTNAFKI